MTGTAERTIRTAVVGYGLSGSVFHAPLIGADARYSLDVIATSNAERQKAATARYPGVRTVHDGDAVLAHAADLDLVVLGTPPATHYPLAKAALEAGLDVVVDKPFAVTSEEGQELVELARELGRVLTVFQNRRWDGDFLTLRKLVAAEAVGKVARFESRFERWSPTIAKAWKARATAADGGGALYDLGSHLIDQALLLFGPATVVHAELKARRADERADDDVFLVLRHESGVLSHLTMNMLCAQQGARFRVLGSVGASPRTGLIRRSPTSWPAAAPLMRSTARRRPSGQGCWAGTATWTPCPPNAAPTRSSIGSWRRRSLTAAQNQICPSR